MANINKVMRRDILAFNGKKVAVSFNGTARSKSFLAWGVCYAKARPAFVAYLKTFKGKVYSLAPENLEFIVAMKCEAEEVDY